MVGVRVPTSGSSTTRVVVEVLEVLELVDVVLVAGLGSSTGDPAVSTGSVASLTGIPLRGAPRDSGARSAAVMVGLIRISCTPGSGRTKVGSVAATDSTPGADRVSGGSNGIGAGVSVLGRGGSFGDAAVATPP
jgi:hypothetical protein